MHSIYHLLNALKSRSVFLFIITTILLTSVFYNNRWGLIEKDFYKYWREIFDEFVIGRLVQSRADGIFSAGGLLLVGDTDHYDISSSTIGYQYDTYYQNGEFKTYWTYNSTSSIQGVIFSAFDKITNFEPRTNIQLFRFGTSMVSAMMLTLVLLWINAEFGLAAYLTATISVGLSPWLVLMGGSLYWQLWSFYLPFGLVLFAILYFNRYGKYSNGMMTAAVLCGVLAKVLFTGFEFITPALVSLTVPFVYFAVRDDWGGNLFIRRFFYAAISGLAAIVLGLLILLTQISFEVDGFRNAFRYIADALGRRATGNPTDYSGVYADALASGVGQVIKSYLLGPAYGLGGGFTGGQNLSSVSHLLIFITFFLFGCFLLWLVWKYKYELIQKRKARALIVTTCYSILSPLSWLIVFKAHAYIHINLDYFVWQLPFMMLGFALVGFTVTSLVHYRNGQTSAGS